MIGDICLKLKEMIKQCFCIHDYTEKTRNSIRQVFLIKECKKCGRMIVKEL